MWHWYGISFTAYVFECHCLSYNYDQILPYFVILDNNNDDDNDNNNDDDDNDNNDYNDNYNNDNNNDNYNNNYDDDYDNKNNNSNDNGYSHNNDANNDNNKIIMTKRLRLDASHCLRIGVFKTKLPGIIDIIGTMSC